VDAVSDDAPLPFKFETGTKNFEGAAGALAAVNYLAELGAKVNTNTALSTREKIVSAMLAIQNYEQKLSGYFISKISNIPNVQIYGIINSIGRSPTFAISSKDGRILPRDVSQKLADKGVRVTTTAGNFYGIKCMKGLLGGRYNDGIVRISMVHYNTLEDIDYLLSCLEVIFS